MYTYVIKDDHGNELARVPVTEGETVTIEVTREDRPDLRLVWADLACDGEVTVGTWAEGSAAPDALGSTTGTTRT